MRRWPVLPTLVRHHRVVVASVADPALTAMAQRRDTTAHAYDAAAAERTLELRDRAPLAVAVPVELVLLGEVRELAEHRRRGRRGAPEDGLRRGGGRAEPRREVGHDVLRPGA